MKFLLKLTRLIVQHPNDAELGKAIRQWYWRRFK